MRRKEIAPGPFLASLPLFKQLDSACIARLAAATSRRVLKRGELLFRKGDPATGMFVVVYGEIKLISSTPVRGKRLSGTVGARQSFGEPVMFLERPAIVDAQAAADSLLLHLPKETLFAEIEHNPRFARRVIAGLSKRIESLVNELERQALGSGRERFIDYLLRRIGDAPGPALVVLPAAKAQVASQLNVTPEHFSRVLHELADAGLLHVEGRRITVPDPHRLQRAAARRPGTAAP